MAERRSILALSAGALAAALLVCAPAQAQPTLEQQVKAAFVAKFAAFVDWPAGVLAPTEPLRICVLGDDGVSAALDQTAGRPLGGRTIAVRRLETAERGEACHVLYAAGSSRQTAAQALQAVRGAPILTVTDSARGPTRGMIHFVVFENRVRFHIDAAQAAQSGIAMNSKLLALALSVRR